MKIARETMDAFAKLGTRKPESFEALDDARKAALTLQCRDMFDNLGRITMIEGVKNLSGAKYVLEQALITALNNLGAPVEQTKIDELAFDAVLALAGPITGTNIAPTTPGSDLPF